MRRADRRPSSRLRLIAATAACALAGCASASPREASIAPCPSPAPAAAVPAPPKATPQNDATIAARLVELVNAQDANALHALFEPEMKAALPVTELREFMRQVVLGKGKLLDTELIAGDRPQVRTFRLRAERGDWQLRIALGERGRIALLSIKAPLRAAPPVAESTVPLRLPLRGRWHVFWGGDRLELNRHADVPNQRRAADLVIVGESGKTHRTDGKTNEDYYAHGRDVVAVADGTVVMAVDGVSENVPGQKDAMLIPGNVVVIEHEPKLFSLYAHLVPGSLRVKRGARVKQGAVIGKVGNSGNSSEPHLHFQLQDGPRMADSYGVDAVFERVRVTRDAETSEQSGYRFLKGDTIEQP